MKAFRAALGKADGRREAIELALQRRRRRDQRHAVRTARVGNGIEAHRGAERMADHGMDRRQPRQGALDGGDELHGGQLVAGRFAVRRHVEGNGGEAALDQRRDDGRELRAVALEAVDQQHDRPLRPNARQQARRRDRCAGRPAATTGPAAAARGGAGSASCGGRTAPPARARRGWRRQERRSAGEERTCPGLQLSAVAPNWACATLRSNEEVCAFT